MRRRRYMMIILVRGGSGSGAPARKHQCLYIAYQIPFAATCRAISPRFQSATIPASMSIGRIYVTTRSEYSRFRPPSQGLPRIILMDRDGEFGLDSVVTTVYYIPKVFLMRWTVLWE